MATSPFTTSAIQETYEYARGRAKLGQRPRGNIYQDRPKENLTFPTTNTSQVSKVTFTASGAGDKVAVKIDGASIPITAAATNTLSAAAGETAIDAAAAEGLFEGVIADADANVAELTITFADYGPHEVEFVAAGTTTATVTTVTAGASGVAAKPGRVACYDSSQPDPTLTYAVEPSTDNATPIGVVTDSHYPTHAGLSNAFTFAAGEAWPVGVAVSAWQKAEVECAIASDVEPADAVYFVTANTADRGKFCALDEGTSQVSDLTVTPDAGDPVSVKFDSLPATPAFASVDLATDNANLAAAINNSAAYAAVLASPAVVSAGKVRVTFADDATHTFTNVGTVVVAHAVVTPAVAGNGDDVAPYPGARFTESRSAEQGTCIVDLG